jgi:chloramphenicol-sensitive protein RarD
MAVRDPSGLRAGVASGFVAYILWGLFPLYWGLLEPASPLEVLAARMVFALASLAVLVTIVGQWPVVRAVLRDRRSRTILLGAALLVSLNWGVFIWAVANDLVVDASLGYFINPLVSVALGVLVLRERLRALQWLAVAIAAVAVLYATLSLGRLPWVALVLAFSFGFYGLAKKLAGVDAVASLTVETMYMTPFALAYLAWLGVQGSLALGSHGVGHALLVVGAGPVTALPLLFFGFAAHRVPLSVLGPLQYVAPSLQLAIGVWWLDEPMSPERWLGFVGVWIALVVFTVDAMRAARRSSDRAREAVPLEDL